MTDDIAIKVDNVSKTFRIPHEKISSLRGAFVNLFRSNGYEEFKALDNVSFEVKKGEFFGIIGRNGSGKSTLLKILAGIYHPDTPVKCAKGARLKGEFHGVKVNGLISPFLELGIGFNPELSGRDNVYLNAAVLGLSHQQIDEKFDDIVRFSELKRFIDQKVKNYSSGMQVRLMFSVAIHANREILLMDEVLAVGDTNFQSKCLTEFNKYKDAGKTVVLVTHDIATVQRYCDRAMLLRNGKIEKIGKPEDVCRLYVEQNMSDEEKRITEEEKRIAEQDKKRIKSQKEKEEKEKKRTEERRKIARIIGVEFLDKDGNAKNVFATGDSLDVRIEFIAYNKVETINIGFGIHSVVEDHVLGCNTQIDNFKIKNDNFVTLRFDQLPLLVGEYYIDIVCFGKFEQNYYDLRQKIKYFKMVSHGKKINYRGTCDLKHKWV